MTDQQAMAAVGQASAVSSEDANLHYDPSATFGDSCVSVAVGIINAGGGGMALSVPSGVSNLNYPSASVSGPAGYWGPSYQSPGMTSMPGAVFHYNQSFGIPAVQFGDH